MKIIIHRYISLFFCLCIILLTNCCVFLRSPVYLEEPTDINQSLVVGYIDMTEDYVNLDFIWMCQLLPRSKYRWNRFSINNGIFFNEFVSPGTYKFDCFGGYTGDTTVTYFFPVQGKKQMDPVIKEPGIYFVGSYKNKPGKESLFEPGKFELIELKHPSEKEVLEQLLDYAGETIWRNRILKRLEELDK